ncbi:MAG: type transport system ATP-binding protein [Thermoleophilaceae bacterium]|nr:type transport system ATP-binding protein [Thermoleophilaceae bacterium]
MIDTRGRRGAAAILTACALALAGAAGAQAAPPLPFGHACAPKAGVLFCPSATLDQRIPSFDGTPMDVDVTLPATGDGPFPLVVVMHGYGGDKTSAQSSGPSTGLDDVGLAGRGYAVVTLSARGFGMSCGKAASRTPDCDKAGWIHLADQRFEGRDTQELIGKLVDEKVVDPLAIGVAGGSYGGGQALELAFLRDRIRLPDGSYAPWKSPNGTPLRIAAAAPNIPWADLAAALVPNGRFTDDQTWNARRERTPVGVPIKSYVNGLYASGNAAGWVAPIGSDPQADLAGWRQLFIDQGEPYGADAAAVGKQMQEYHSALAIPGEPAPLLISNGWTDDLFPAPHALRAYNTIRARNAKAPVSLVLGAFGHPRGGTGEPATGNALLAEEVAFFGAYLKGTGTPPKAGSVTAALTTCPKGKRAPIYHASSWAAIARKVDSFFLARTQTVKSSGGDPALGQAFDPVGAKVDPCTEIAAEKPAGSAIIDGPIRSTVTQIGPTEIRATVAARGRDGQLAGRLWDVDPKSGKMRLADRGVYRLTPDQKGKVRFQLHGNGRRWLKGHIARLELSGSDAGYLRPSNTAFSVKVSRMTLALPVR